MLAVMDDGERRTQSKRSAARLASSSWAVAASQTMPPSSGFMAIRNVGLRWRRGVAWMASIASLPFNSARVFNLHGTFLHKRLDIPRCSRLLRRDRGQTTERAMGLFSRPKTKAPDLGQNLVRASVAWKEAMSPHRDQFGLIQLPRAPRLQQHHVDGARLFADRETYLDHLPKGAVCAEVGVGMGNFSAEILKRTQAKTLHLIDIDFDRFKVRERFAHEPRVMWHQGRSIDVLNLFPPAYFDWVYIDADRSYDAVKADAATAASRLKPDGTLVFNDYIFWSHAEAMPYGIVHTVNDMCINDGWRVVAFCLHDWMYCDIAIRRADQSTKMATRWPPRPASP